MKKSLIAMTLAFSLTAAPALAQSPNDRPFIQNADQQFAYVTSQLNADARVSAKDVMRFMNNTFDFSKLSLLSAKESWESAARAAITFGNTTPDDFSMLDCIAQTSMRRLYTAEQTRAVSEISFLDILKKQAAFAKGHLSAKSACRMTSA